MLPNPGGPFPPLPGLSTAHDEVVGAGFIEEGLAAPAKLSPTDIFLRREAGYTH